MQSRDQCDALDSLRFRVLPALQERQGYAEQMCIRDSFSAANAMAYAGIVRDRARRRALVSLGGQIQRWAVEDGDAEQTLLRLKRSLDALDGGPDAGGLVPLRELLSGCADAIDRRYYCLLYTSRCV